MFLGKPNVFICEDHFYQCWWASCNMWRSWKEGKCGRGKILLSPLSGRSISTCFHISLHSWHFGFGLWLTSALPGFCEPSAWTQYIIGLLSLWNHFCQSSIIHFSFWLNFHKEPWLTQSLTLYVKLIWKSNFCLLWSILREFVSYALLTFQHWGDRSLSHPILGTMIFHISFIFFFFPIGFINFSRKMC